MTESDDISQITLGETWIHNHWYRLSNIIREDIAYIWTDDAKETVRALKSDASKITFVLRRLHRLMRDRLGQEDKTRYSDYERERYAEQIKALKRFIHDLNHLKAKQKWVQRIGEDINQILEELEAEKAHLKAIKEQTPKIEKAKRFATSMLYLRRFRQLQSWGFDTTRYHSLALFLARHWDDIGSFYYREHFLMFRRGLPAIADIINEKNWPELVRLAKGTTDRIYNAKYEIFAYTLPCLKPLIQELGLHKVVDDLIYLSKFVNCYSEEGKKGFFALGLPAVKDLINKDTWPGIIEMAKVSRSDILLTRGLPAIWDMINRVTWPGLVKLAKQAEDAVGVQPFIVFNRGLPCVRHITNDRTWPDIVSGFEKLIKLRDDAVFQYSLPSIKHLITEENWLAIVQEFCELHKKSKDVSVFQNHIHSALPYLKHIMDKQTYPLVLDELLQLYIEFARKECGFFWGEQEVFGRGIAAIGPILTKENFPLVFQELRKAVEKFGRPAILFLMLYAIRYILTEQNLSKILDEIFVDEDMRDFLLFLVNIRHLIKNKTDLEEMISYRDKHRRLFGSVVMGYMASFFGDISSKKELFDNLDKVAYMADDKRYYTVQGLSSMGFLCCHVTNAFAGGAAGGYQEKKDPFANIVNDIRNAFDYNPSASVIKPEGKSSLVTGGGLGGEIRGSIGVIYDYGYLYRSYLGDVGTWDVKGEKSGISYRTSMVKNVPSPIVSNFSTSEYNEVLLRKWTVSGIFYTKGCAQWAIDRLKQISDEMSSDKANKEGYINGEYWYRATKFGVPKRKKKIFPVYEVDTSTNTWKVVYTPPAPEGYGEEQREKIVPFRAEEYSEKEYRKVA